MTRRRFQRLLPRRISLRARLTLIYGVMFLAAGVVLLGTTYALFSQRIETVGPSVTQSNSPPEATPPAADRDGASNDSPSAVTDDGDVLTGTDAAQWLDTERDKLQDSATSSLLTQGGIALLVVGSAAGALGWLVAGRVLAPLHRVTDTAQRIAVAPAADRGLHERIALSGPDDEVKELADTFDAMVARLDRSFDGQRRFVANASHELRTPLTLTRGLVEVAMHRKTASDDIKQLGENLLEVNARHERLITGLLLLASSEQEIGDRRYVDLADVTTHVVAQTATEAEQAGVAVLDETTEAATTGDALLLERLVHNLVENGIRHNVDAGGWIRVETRTGDRGTVELEVANTGPKVPAYEIPALFEPFHRHDADRLVTAKGAGLGLSIVDAITRAHGGQVSAKPRPGGGLIVTVTLPATPVGAPWQSTEVTPRSSSGHSGAEAGRS